MSELISIIIPLYNREHLVKETLESILSQTYQNWECVIVDDGSTDRSLEVVNAYAKIEPRIKIFERPSDRAKGANACRNYGFEKSKGDYIVWFDSDDIMLENYLELHLKPLTYESYNFSISKFDNLGENGEIDIEPLFCNNTHKDINGNEFLKQQAFFGTINVMFKRKFIIGTSWDEFLKSGQEYNFFCKILISTRAVGAYLDTSLCLRLIHNNSIQSNQNREEVVYLENKLDCYYQTLLDTYDDLQEDELQFLINHCLSFYYRLMRYKSYSYNIKMLRFVLRHLTSFKRLLFKLSLILNKYFKKGYFFYRKSTFTAINRKS
jgi:glycosyltransferase involved in cell wall biosynthesis